MGFTSCAAQPHDWTLNFNIQQGLVNPSETWFDSHDPTQGAFTSTFQQSTPDKRYRMPWISFIVTSSNGNPILMNDLASDGPFRYSSGTIAGTAFGGGFAVNGPVSAGPVLFPNGDHHQLCLP